MDLDQSIGTMNQDSLYSFGKLSQFANWKSTIFQRWIIYKYINWQFSHSKLCNHQAPYISIHFGCSDPAGTSWKHRQEGRLIIFPQQKNGVKAKGSWKPMTWIHDKDLVTSRIIPKLMILMLVLTMHDTCVHPHDPQSRNVLKVGSETSNWRSDTKCNSIRGMFARTIHVVILFRWKFWKAMSYMQKVLCLRTGDNSTPYWKCGWWFHL